MKKLLTKSDIVEKLTAFAEKEGLQLSEITLSHGGSLVMHGLKETTRDMDVSVRKFVFHQFASHKRDWHGKLVPINEIEYLVPYDEYIDIHDDKHRMRPPCIQVIDGIHCETIQDVLMGKLYLNRAKDQPDIEMIMRHLLAELDGRPKDV